MESQSVRWLEATWRACGARGGTWIALRGSSMEPTLGDGDWLRVEPLAGGVPAAPGDVVVSRRGERLVTHRLLELGDGLAVTRGDACRASDPPVTAEALLGRVVEVRTGARRALGLRRRSRRVLEWLRRGR